MTKLDDQITNLLALAEKATAGGQWRYYEDEEERGITSEAGVVDSESLTTFDTWYGMSAEDMRYVALAASLALVLAERVRVLERVARAGNLLFQFGIRHDDDCATKHDGECTCGLATFSSEFIRAWSAWQDNDQGR